MRAVPQLLGLTLLLLLAPSCREQGAYPHRPVTIVCPWAIGGGTDKVSRQMAALLEQELGVPANVVNETGGEGVTGHVAGAWADPDGYTLTLMTSELNMLHWRGRTSVRLEDFTLLMVLNRDAAALFVREDAPWTTIQELAAAVRARRGSGEPVRASGTSAGGTWHLAFAGWLVAAGLSPADAAWISTRGAGPSLHDLVAGSLDVVCCSLPEARPLLESGKVRSLGVMADERIPGFEDVPVFREAGVPWRFLGWRALGVPRRTPEPVVRVLKDAIRSVTASPAFLDFMRGEGFGVSLEEGEPALAGLEAMDREIGALLSTRAFADLEAGRFSSSFFPAVLGTSLAAVLLGLAASRRSGEERPPPLGRSGWTEVLKVVLAAGTYMLIAETAGFIVAASLVLFLLFWSFGSRLFPSAVLAFAVACGVYQIFAVHLRVDLPRELLWW